MDKHRYSYGAIILSILAIAWLCFGQAFTFNDPAFMGRFGAGQFVSECDSNSWADFVPTMTDGSTPYGTAYGYTAGGDDPSLIYQAFDNDPDTYVIINTPQLDNYPYVIWSNPTGHVAVAYSLRYYDAGNGPNYTNICPTSWSLFGSDSTNSNPIGSPALWTLLSSYTNTPTFPLRTNIYYIPTNQTPYYAYAVVFKNSALGTFLYEAQFLGCQ